jgi:hypothetical protein
VLKRRKMRWVWHVARVAARRDAYRVLVGRYEAKEPLDRPRRRWEDNIKIDLQAVGLGGMHWVDLAQDMDRYWALENAVMNHRVP